MLLPCVVQHFVLKKKSAFSGGGCFFENGTDFRSAPWPSRWTLLCQSFAGQHGQFGVVGCMPLKPLAQTTYNIIEWPFLCSASQIRCYGMGCTPSFGPTHSLLMAIEIQDHLPHHPKNRYRVLLHQTHPPTHPNATLEKSTMYKVQKIPRTVQDTTNTRIHCSLCLPECCFLLLLCDSNNIIDPIHAYSCFVISESWLFVLWPFLLVAFHS